MFHYIPMTPKCSAAGLYSTPPLPLLPPSSLLRPPTPTPTHPTVPITEQFHRLGNQGLSPVSNLFSMKAAKDFSDGHLWFSVISRPRSSTFTSVQRVSCCFSLLLCTMLTSIMFYGIPTDPSEQTMDLGSTKTPRWFFTPSVTAGFVAWLLLRQFEHSVCLRGINFVFLSLFFDCLCPGHFEFTWQQFMIGVQSSLIMFPVNILIVSIFRNTRPWESCCSKSNTEMRGNTLEQTGSLQSAADQTVSFETVVKVSRFFSFFNEKKQNTKASDVECLLGK